MAKFLLVRKFSSFFSSIFFLVLFFNFLFFTSSLKSEELSVPNVGGKVENIKVFDFNGNWFNLLDFAGGEKFILSPIYTSCPHACSTITSNLKKAMADMKRGYKVITFSFDDRDTTENLLIFARRWELDGRNWTVVSAKREDIEKLLKSIGFWIKRVENGEILHPNIVYVVDGRSGLIIAAVDAIPFDMKSLKIALSHGSVFDKFIFLFFNFNPLTRRYEFDTNFIFYSAFLSLFLLLLLLFLLTRYIFFRGER